MSAPTRSVSVNKASAFHFLISNVKVLGDKVQLILIDVLVLDVWIARPHGNGECLLSMEALILTLENITNKFKSVCYVHA